MTKTQYVIISKKQLDEAAESAPDKTSLVNELKHNHDVVPGDGHNFMLCGHDTNDEPFILGMNISLDWEFLTTLKHSIDEEFDQASAEEKAHIRSRVFSDVLPDVVSLVQMSASNGVNREAHRHLPILPFDGLEPEESENLVLLLQEARAKAEHWELSAFQLFIEEKLEKLMPNNPRIAAFNQLPDDKKTQARQQLIERMSWGDYYTA